ncbi:MAG: type IVB secretion system protein IcmH/DotU [Acidobacteria bacterium]|nr:type IVB secretion system protein IcmH/DotU [Acidobacteriota bacterium]MCI0719319.1 type IVB secretion system protein IcmH/DotU [Acidobacteriota bacterium]
MKEASIVAKSLSDLCTEIFLAILQVQRTRDIGSFDSFHPNVQKLFESFEHKCKALGVEAGDVGAAKYALAAFADETVLNSQWHSKDRWADNPLQLDYFGTYLAGEIFFDKLEEARARADTKPDLLQIYYFCLLLGFKGKYGVGGEEKLRSLVETVGAELSRVKPAAIKELAPHWKIPDAPQAPATDKLPRWLVLTCWAIVAFALVLYLGLFFKVRHDAQTLKENIQTQTAG